MDRRVPCRLAARALGGSGRWCGSGYSVMLYSCWARSRVGGLDLVNVIPLLVVLFFGLGILALAARRDLDARIVFLFVGVGVVLSTGRVVDCDVSPKLNLDVSVASIFAGGRERNSACRRDRNGGGTCGGTCSTRNAGGGSRRGSTTGRAVRKRPPGRVRGSALMRKSYD